MSDQQKQGNDFRTTIGGQALMEGILMRGPKKALYYRSEVLAFREANTRKSNYKQK